VGLPVLLRGEPATGGLQRVVLGLIDEAVELLESYPRRSGREREETVHEVRKLLKRLRALLRLLRPQLGHRRFERENVALRDCGRRLSGARDAEVMVATLDELVRRHRGRLAGSGGVARLRAELVAERERAVAVEDPAVREAVIGELAGVRERVARWQLRPHSGGGGAGRLLEPGLRRVYATGRRRLRGARREEDVGRLHALRKSAKDLRYVAETLQRGDGAGSGSRGAGRRMRRVARRADRLGEMLGEEHDLALLRGVVRRRFGGGRRKRKLLLKLIARRRRRLRRRSLELADRVYRRRPRRFVRGLRGAL
jgi:CHAD domain-containing protein